MGNYSIKAKPPENKGGFCDKPQRQDSHKALSRY